MKLLFSFLICILFSLSVSAQFFGRLDPLSLPKTVKKATNSLVFNATTTSLDSTFWGLRPIVTGATAYIGGTVKAMAGTGISYQNLTYTYPVGNTPGRYYCNYAISALVFAGGSVIPNKPTDIMSGGIMLSFLNNMLGTGICGGKVENPTTGEKKFKIGFMTTYTINFNN